MPHSVTLYPTEDTWLDEANPTTNNDGTGTLKLIDGADQHSAGTRASPLLRFDFSSIPSDANIVGNVLLSLWQQSGGTDTSHSFSIGTHPLRRVWVTAQATWSIWSTGNNWGSPGSRSLVTDCYDYAHSCYGPYDTEGWKTWTIPGDCAFSSLYTTAHDAFVADGILLFLDYLGNGATISATFADSSDENGHKPKLEFAYTSYSAGSCVGTAKWFLPLRLATRAATDDGTIPPIEYKVVSVRTGLGKADPGAQTIILDLDGKASQAWRVPKAVAPLTAPGLFRLPLTETEAEAQRISLDGTCSNDLATIKESLNLPGPRYTPKVDVVKIAGNATTPGQLNDEIKSIARGVVQDNVGNSTTVLYTTLPLRGTNGYANQFATVGLDSGTTPFSKTRFILSSADSGSDTVLTFEREWAAPPAGTSIAVKGNEEAAV
jgi:hypothetical protein